MIDEKNLIEELDKKLYAMQIVPMRQVINIINGQPKVGEWIPCSERMPDDGIDVLVWFEYFRYGNYNRLFQTTGISFTNNGNWSGFVNVGSGWKQLRIIAWMPMPEPYKEG